MTPNLERLACVVGAKSTFEPFDLTELPLPAGLTVAETSRDYLAATPDVTWEVGYYHLLCRREIIDQTLNYIPGYHCVPFGLITIARDLSGNSASLDLETGRVYPLDHEKFEEDGLHLGWNKDMTGFLPVVPYSKPAILDTAEVSWDDASAFISDLIEGYQNETEPNK